MIPENNSKLRCYLRLDGNRDITSTLHLPLSRLYQLNIYLKAGQNKNCHNKRNCKGNVKMNF